ncbi:MAG: nuclear transport factor 2 family protein [Phycisphaerales bacterium]|nr:nuclear transport factor 2 family protein [Phycisphaerales bacterium]
MTTENQTQTCTDIAQCIERYYESLCTSDADGVQSVFHPSAKITGYLPDGLHEMTVDDFAGFVQSQQPSPDEQGADRMLEVLSCEVAGDTASVRIREAYLGMIFVDTFGMLCVDGDWLIYNKLFHVEG